MTSPKTLARIAGSLYLVMSVCFIFATVVGSRIVEPANPVATADNIRASAALFRFSLVSDLVSAGAFLLTAMALYLLLKHVHQLVAAAMVTFVAVGVAVQCLNLLNQYAALTIATHEDYARALGRPGANAPVMLFADMHTNGLLIDGLFFGLWLLPLGYLVIKSGYFPRLLGVLLIIGCFSYLSSLFLRPLAPDLAGVASVLGLGDVGELLFLAWLVVKAVSVPAPAAPVPVTAPQQA